MPMPLLLLLLQRSSTQGDQQTVPCRLLYLRKLAPLRWVVAVPNISGDIWLGEDVLNMLTFKYMEEVVAMSFHSFIH